MRKSDIDRAHDIHERGKLGERYVCDYLAAHGCTIVQTNYKCRYGEIDIIAENEARLIFVEVKTRTDHSFVGGFESITPSKIKRVTTTAADYLCKNPTEKQIRIDCAQVIVDKDNQLVKIDYIKNAVTQ